MTKNKPIRHGEVLLYPVDSVPKGKTTKHDLYIVGHSETGHHHILESKGMQVTQTNKELFVRLFNPGRLNHKKTVNRHNDLTVAPGIYRSIRKTEYDPFLKMRREVWD
jgi:hypothetical protein